MSDLSDREAYGDEEVEEEDEEEEEEDEDEDEEEGGVLYWDWLERELSFSRFPLSLLLLLYSPLLPPYLSEDDEEEEEEEEDEEDRICSVLRSFSWRVNKRICF